MKIFEITRATSYSTKYADFHILENSTWSSELFFRNQYENKHELPIPYYTLNKYTPTDFPFLQQPLMRTNLLKDDSNLSLIIGHNGGHTANYNTLLDSEVDLLKSRLSRKYKNIKVTDYMKYDYIVIDIENSVTDIISKLKNKLKIDEGKIGNLLTSNKIYILD
ncbi:MAG: hypothetical protein PUC37_07530 [Spirochaetales bacterium]|nr:hypothetical protein [Spirochaetales bacterium]